MSRLRPLLAQLAAVLLAPLVYWYDAHGAGLYAGVLVLLVVRGVMREVSPASRELDALVAKRDGDSGAG